MTGINYIDRVNNIQIKKRNKSNKSVQQYKNTNINEYKLSSNINIPYYKTGISFKALPYNKELPSKINNILTNAGKGTFPENFKINTYSQTINILKNYAKDLLSAASLEDLETNLKNTVNGCGKDEWKLDKPKFAVKLLGELENSEKPLLDIFENPEINENIRVNAIDTYLEKHYKIDDSLKDAAIKGLQSNSDIITEKSADILGSNFNEKEEVLDAFINIIEGKNYNGKRIIIPALGKYFNTSEKACDALIKGLKNENYFLTLNNIIGTLGWDFPNEKTENALIDVIKNKEILDYVNGKEVKNHAIAVLSNKFNSRTSMDALFNVIKTDNNSYTRYVAIDNLAERLPDKDTADVIKMSEENAGKFEDILIDVLTKDKTIDREIFEKIVSVLGDFNNKKAMNTLLGVLKNIHNYEHLEIQQDRGLYIRGCVRDERIPSLKEYVMHILSSWE